MEANRITFQGRITEQAAHEEHRERNFPEPIDWKTCSFRHLVKNTSKDKELVVSLVKIAENKIITSSMIKLNEITISSIVVILYDASRTLLEALAVMKGYKIYNHECYFAFLKEIIKNEKMAFLFNKLRLIRNGINYYGEPILLIEGNIAVKELNELILFTKEEIRKEMKK